MRNAAGTILGADNKAAVASMIEAARRALDGGPAARGARARLHGEGGGRPARRVRLRPHAAPRRARLRLRPGGADRRDRHRRAVGGDPRGRLPRPLGARGHVPGGGPLGDRRRGPRHRRPSPRSHRRRDLGQRRTSSKAARRATSSPSTARSRPRRGATTRQSSRTSCGRWRRRSPSRPRSRSARWRRRSTARTAATASARTSRRSRSPPSALERCGFTPSYALTGGGADANVFNERGIPCVTLANAMAEIHTPDEHIAVADVEAMVDVSLALLDGALA